MVAARRDRLAYHPDAVDSPSTLSRFFAERSDEGTDVVDDHLEAGVLASLFGKTSPAKFDRFVLLEPIGRGAMGTVFAAYDPKLDRRIALKVMRDDDEKARRRHLAEARALAQVNHPNVVAVHDAGEHEDSLYVAMELVDGATLAEHLSSKSPAPKEIVRLFIEAGQGLVAAHAAGVVHRDFKPANVMVGDDRRVRVADFGLALSSTESQAHSQTSGEEGDETSRRRGAGTPMYMAPEQARGEDADARSDQFAFCVALVEALTGEVPFRSRSAVERLEKIEAGLGATERPLPLGVRRIVRRGLASRPSERFADMQTLVSALIADQKRPRRWAQLGVSAALVGVAVFGATTGSGTAPCSERPLDDEWATKRGELREAFLGADVEFAGQLWKTTESALDGYVAEWTESATTACRATRVTGEHSEQLLDLRMACLERRRSELHATWELLAEPNAATLENTPRLVAALPDLQWCQGTQALLEAAPLPTDAELRETVSEIREELARIRPLRFVRPDEAKLAIEALVERADSLEYAPVEAELALVLARQQRDAGGLEEAAATFKRALWLAEGVRLDEVAAAAAEGLIMVEGIQGGQHERGKEWAELARAIHRRQGRPEGLTSELARKLGVLAMENGDPERGLRWAERSLELADTPFLELKARLRIADATSDLGDRTAAVPRLEETLALAREMLGERHPDVATVLNSYGNALSLVDRAEDAIAALTEAAEIEESLRGAGHPRLAKLQSNLADVLLQQGRMDEAAKMFEAVNRSMEAAFGPQHPNVAMGYVNLASVLLMTQRAEEALPLCESAKKALGDVDSPRFTPYVAMCFGTVLVELDRAAEAAQAVKPFVEGEVELPDVLRAEIQSVYGRALYVGGRQEEGVRWVRAAAVEERKTQGLAEGQLSRSEQWLRAQGL